MAFAFLFDCDHPKAARLDGDTFDEAFLRELKTVDIDDITRTRVYRGGFLIASLSYRTSAIGVTPRRRRTSGGPISSSVETTETADMALYATLVGDFVETCLELWNTLDSRRLWDYVANHSLYSLCAPGLPSEFASSIDARLRAHPCYVGAVAPDLGNPLHRHLFMEVMFNDAFIHAGNVFVQAGLEGDYAGDFDGAAEFSKQGMVILGYEHFEAACPPIDLPASLSARGLVTQMRMQRRMAPDLHEKLAMAVLNSPIVKDQSRTFEWNLNQLPDSADEVEVQARKLTDYLLDPEHKDGKSKAAFFAQFLGITRVDWSFLQAQLIDGLAKVCYEDVRLDEHGIRFSAVLPIKGRNGAAATIHTAWIVRPGERASFITAFPSEKDAKVEALAAIPAIVPHELTAADRWKAIFDLADEAGSAAARACVPKPMVIEGTVYMDGECGGAAVVVQDARRGFARWLKATGKGEQYYQGGYSVSARQTGQAAERAKAYAVAFATVLRRNGVSCRVETYLT